MPEEPERIQAMIAQLDVALHGTTFARDASPGEVWDELLAEVIDMATRAEEDAGE